MPARRWSPTRASGSSRSPARPRPAAGSASSRPRHLKRVHLELGGNSALIVLDDADLDAAVSAGAWGSFLHQGQICMTAGRHIVHESVADAYVAALAEHADAPAGRRPGHRPGRARPADRRRPARQGARPGDGHCGRRGAARRRRHLRGAVLPADRAGRGATGHAGLRRGGLRPGRPGASASPPSRRPLGSPPTPGTGCRWASSPAT